ncbi:MAG: transposase [Pseudomonadota bacterium]
MTDREWSLVPPLLPAPKPGGRPRATCLRRIVNAVFYLLQSGFQWRTLPQDSPPRSTVYGDLRRCRDDGTWARVDDVLYRRCRDLEGREESPSATLIYGQNVKTGPDARDQTGFDAGKKIKGHKRQLFCDTLGLMMRIEVHSACIRDRV